MATFFLIVIYVAFIGLGLPDSALGASWPVMHQSLGIPIENAGILSVLTTGGTILSSFLSGRVTRRFGTGKVTLISVLMTALALLGFSLAPDFYWLAFLTLPLGLGAGSVDAALNGYVSLNYEAKHMSWLHSFWGVGATTGPMILSFFLLTSSGWRAGYRVISFIQIGIVLLLFLTLPLWKRFEGKSVSDQSEEDSHERREEGSLYRIPGVRYAILSFFAYCGVEMTMGLWGSSYLVNFIGYSAETAARYTSLYFGGITLGRFLTGFITMKLPLPYHHQRRHPVDSSGDSSDPLRRHISPLPGFSTCRLRMRADFSRHDSRDPHALRKGPCPEHHRYPGGFRLHGQHLHACTLRLSCRERLSGAIHALSLHAAGTASFLHGKDQCHDEEADHNPRPA